MQERNAEQCGGVFPSMKRVDLAPAMPGSALIWGACFAVMAAWVFMHLGGLRLSPKDLGEAGNDTSQLFNWHPLLITLAFPVVMAEAVLAYKTPLLALPDRYSQPAHVRMPQKKAWHVVLQSSAGVLVLLAVVAAFKSHTLKRPTPMANLYSAHSYLGMLVLTLFSLQYAVGFAAYLFPRFTLANRRALGPLHIFLGKAIFTLGLATMAVGIQEKATFVQLLAKPGLYSSVMALPAVLQLLLALTGMAVLFHHAPPAAPAPKPEVETAEVEPRHHTETEPLYSPGDAHRNC